MLLVNPGVAGVDEAGRGPIAGPVVVAAVVLPEDFDATGIDDSKVLSREARRTLCERIKKECLWATSIVSVQEIDRLNILWATMAGMERALQHLPRIPETALIDGNRIPLAAPCLCTAVVDGDAIHANIAAASIIAKETRDVIMEELAVEYPGYGFEQHFGYCTQKHQVALRELGPCAIHRTTFEPVQQMLLQPCLVLE